MKILYLSFSYLPSRRANTVHVMRMCEAFAGLGHQVTLVGKRPLPEDRGRDDFEQYGMQPVFGLRKRARPQIRGGELVYALGVIRELLARRPVDLVYGRYLFGVWVATRLGLPVVLEMHGLNSGRWSRRMLRGILRAPGFRRLILISRGLEEDVRAAGVLPQPAMYRVAHDGAEADLAVPQAAAPLPGGPHLAYVGGFYRGRGLALLVRLAHRLPRCRFHLIGGDRRQLARIVEGEPPENLVCHGYVPHARIASLCRRFDVLLMPYERDIEVAGGPLDVARWASPMKMFEYMAAGKPIVSSDLPVLREVLKHDRNALLAPPDDTAAWEAALDRLLGSELLRRRLGDAARRDLETHYTWRARARRVLEGVEGPSPPAAGGGGR